MGGVVDKYKQELRENREIEYRGLKLYPLKMRDYSTYAGARVAYELLLSSLPAKLARLSWCSCLWEMDKEIVLQGGEALYFPAAMRVLALALELQPEGLGKEERYPLRPLYTKDSLTLKHLEIRLPDSHIPALISLQDMNRVREIIAAQNCYDMPDESWNPELLRAQEYLRGQRNGGNGLKPDIEAAVYSVAAGTGRRAGEIWDWPIREFLKTKEALERKYDYQIYTGAEMSGFVKFKHGNPCPSWIYDREAELPGGFMSIAELDAGHKGLLGESKQNSKE